MNHGVQTTEIHVAIRRKTASLYAAVNRFFGGSREGNAIVPTSFGDREYVVADKTARTRDSYFHNEEDSQSNDSAEAIKHNILSQANGSIGELNKRSPPK